MIVTITVSEKQDGRLPGAASGIEGIGGTGPILSFDAVHPFGDQVLGEIDGESHAMPAAGHGVSRQTRHRVRLAVVPPDPSRNLRSLPTVAVKSQLLKSHWPVTAGTLPPPVTMVNDQLLVKVRGEAALSLYTS